MKKGKQNFKVLTQAEANKVKGGGWFSDWLKSMYNGYQASQAQSMQGDDCPPPEPPDNA